MKQPNNLLRRARENIPSPNGTGAPLTRQELADLVNAYLVATTMTASTVDENYIGKLELGTIRWPRDPQRRAAFRHILNASTDADLGFFRPRRAPHRPIVDRGAQPSAGEPAWAGPEPAERGDDDVDRRRLISSVAAALGGATIAPATRLLDGLLDPQPHAQAGAAEIAAVTWAAQACTTLDFHYGGQAATEMAAATLRWATPLLTAATGPTRSDLAVAVGVLADRNAWALYDTGRDGAAARCWTLALSAAQEGNDPDLRAHIAVNAAVQIGARDPRLASHLVQHALDSLRLCRPQAANLHAALGGHLARAGEHRAALEHITHAEQLITKGGQTPDWAAFLTTQHLNSVLTQTLAVAGAQQEAIGRIQALLITMDPGRRRGRANRMIDLATLYAHSGRHEEARDLAAQAADALHEVGSARAHASLAVLNRTLAPR